MKGALTLRWPSEATLARVATSLAVPLLALGAWSGWRGGTTEAFLGSVAVRFWGAAMLLSLAAGAASAARARRPSRVVAWGTACAASIALAVAAGSRYSGVLELGVGEPPGRWASLAAGPFASPPVVEVVALPSDGEGRAVLRIRGRDAEGRPGEPMRVGADRLQVTRVAPAVAFELRRRSGELLDGLFVKLHPGEPNEFGFERLPHRVLAPLEASGDVTVAAPAALRLRVQRGKLAVADQTVRRGEPLRFEGLTLGFGEGERWARIEARGGRPGGYRLALGFALLTVGAAWLDRRRRGA